ncbi:MAG: suppressor of fused domain protein [Defluviitaleaceae bacterium]|nr:suppressor of fused domain protein [Defluviitaleaceae bacterium]
MKKARYAQKSKPQLYSEKEMAVIESHISKHYGKFNVVLHEKVSSGIHVDIAVIEPTKKRNFYTLVTMGMGVHRMNVPPELADEGIDRAELMICLPPDWKLPKGCDICKGGESNSADIHMDESWYWPIRWLKILARLPIENNSWLGYGHTIPNGVNAEPFAENTKLGCILLIPPIQFEEDAQVCEMPDASSVGFYQLLPIYADEMGYKLEKGTGALLDKFNSHQGITDLLTLDINRPSALSG